MMQLNENILLGIVGVTVWVAVWFFLLYLWKWKQYRLLKQESDHRMKLYQKEKEEFSAYEQFFPRKLFGLLGIDCVQEVSMQLSRTFDASALSVNVLDYHRAIHTMEAEKLFFTINELFSQLVPLVLQSGGVVESFQKSGLTAMYLDSSEAILHAAVSMCEIVEQQKQTDTYDNFSIGIDYGEVMLGIVGNEQRRAAVAMSQAMSISEFLQEKALKYGARILATSHFTQRIANFHNQYNSRWLGYLYDSMKNAMIEIYDIYDGDPPERKQGKRRTRMIFEQGVERFIHGEYDAARLHFVEVLKADRYDRAARAYLYLCDGYCTGRTKKIQIFIEKF